jgi:hypothetical protein
MNKPQGYDQATPQTFGFDNPPAGAYVCKIIGVKSEKTGLNAKNPNTDMIAMAIDIEEGQYKGNFKKMFERMKLKDPNKKYPCIFRRTLSPDQLNYFKGDILAIEESNEGYKWNWNDESLKGKLVGFIFGEKEIDSNGKTVLEPRFICSAGKARVGNIKPPSKKLYVGSRTNNSFGFENTVAPNQSQQSDIPPVADEEPLPF